MGDTKQLSPEHLEALDRGRRSARAVKAYLNWLDAEASRPRGRRRSAEELEHALAQLEHEIELSASPIKRLELIQRRIDTRTELDALHNGGDVDSTELEAAFIAAAADYSNRKNISYTAWREIGVSPGVLNAAGIARTRRN